MTYLHTDQPQDNVFAHYEIKSYSRNLHTITLPAEKILISSGFTTFNGNLQITMHGMSAVRI